MIRIDNNKLIFSWGIVLIVQVRIYGILNLQLNIFRVKELKNFNRRLTFFRMLINILKISTTLIFYPTQIGKIKVR
jgi:hypothetical protein